MYFSVDNSYKKLLFSRNHRLIIKGSFSNYFYPGDIIFVAFQCGVFTYTFEGLCIALRLKNFRSNSSIILRSVIATIGVEFSFSYFYNRAFSLRLNDYKRKVFYTHQSKLFYLRKLKNKNSRVKN